MAIGGQLQERGGGNVRDIIAVTSGSPQGSPQTPLRWLPVTCRRHVPIVYRSPQSQRLYLLKDSSLIQSILFHIHTLQPFAYKSPHSQLLRVLLLNQYIRGIIVLYILGSILASHIHILGYLLGHPLSKASLLVLLFLFLRVLLLYFLPLLGLFRALKCLPPIVLTMLQLRFLLS